MTPPAPTREQWLARWSELHGGYDVTRGSRLVRGWLAVVYPLARPVAVAGVSPHALTALAVALALCATSIAQAWPLLAAVAVLVAALADGLDGAVAVLAHKESQFGAILDSVADRASDALFLVALWRAGAAPLWCLVAAAGLTGLEYTRARAGAVGITQIAVVTVGERPTRVVLAVLGLVFARTVATAPTLAAAATAAVTGVGLVQLCAEFGRIGAAPSGRRQERTR